MEMTPEEQLAYNQEQSIELQDWKRWEISWWEVRQVLADEATNLDEADEATQIKYFWMTTAEADDFYDALVDDEWPLWEAVEWQTENEYYERTYYHPGKQMSKIVICRRANPLFPV